MLASRRLDCAESISGSRRRSSRTGRRASRVVGGRAFLDRRTVHVDDRRRRSRRRVSARPAIAARLAPHGLRVPLLRDGRADRRAGRLAHRGPPVHRARDRAAGDVRGPGRDRHRERPAVRGAGAAQRRASGEQPPGHRGAGAADGHRRGAAGDRRPRRPICSRCSTRSPRAPLSLCGADDAGIYRCRRRSIRPSRSSTTVDAGRSHGPCDHAAAARSRRTCVGRAVARAADDPRPRLLADGRQTTARCARRG